MQCVIACVCSAAHYRQYAYLANHRCFLTAHRHLRSAQIISLEREYRRHLNAKQVIAKCYCSCDSSDVYRHLKCLRIHLYLCRS
jgi:hypothetical protein